MVEQRDTEEFAALTAPVRSRPTNIDAASHVPPVLTRPGFTPACTSGADHVSTSSRASAKDIGEYYREPGLD